MKDKIFPKSNKQDLLENAFLAPLKSYYFGEGYCNKTINELFKFINYEFIIPPDNFIHSCEDDWSDELNSIEIDVSNLSETMIKFWNCVFGVAIDSSYLGKNYRRFADKIFHRIIGVETNKIQDLPPLLEEWIPTEEDIKFINAIQGK